MEKVFGEKKNEWHKAPYNKTNELPQLLKESNEFLLVLLVDSF